MNRTSNIVSFIGFVATFSLLGACVELKQVGRTVGHTSRDVAKEIGHASRDVAKEITRGTKRVITEATEPAEASSIDESSSKLEASAER